MGIDIEKDAKATLEAAKKKNAEARDAAKGSSPKKQKTKEELEKEKVATDAKKKAEDQVKIDKDILSKKEEELNDGEKKRKGELLDIKKKGDEKLLSTPDDKLDEEGKKQKTVLLEAKKTKEKSNVQKRIDELVGKIKVLEKKDKDSSTVKAELEDLKKQLSMTPEDQFKEQVKKARTDRISKQIEEDKDKPREERREMTKEALDTWVEEDFVGAQRWISRNEMNRTIEDEAYQGMLVSAKRRKDIIDKQKPSEEKVLAKHPELDTDKREKELKAEGKKPDEIHKILMEENEKYRITSEIIKEDPKKYLMSNDGPELVAAEMEKRISGKGAKKEEMSKVEELEKKLSDVSNELERLKGLDVSLISNRSSETKDDTNEMGKKQSNLASEVGLDPKKVAARIKKREAKGYGR